MVLVLWRPGCRLGLSCLEICRIREYSLLEGTDKDHGVPAWGTHECACLAVFRNLFRQFLQVASKKNCK